MKRYAVILTLSLLCVLALGGCQKKKQEKTDLTSTHTTAATETMSSTTAAADSGKETTGSGDAAGEKETAKTPEKDETAKAEAAASVTTSIRTYTNGGISVEYPVISNLSQASVQEKVNRQLNEYALEFMKAYDVDESKDTLTIKCDVISADRRRITAVYTGTYTAEGGAYPLNVFYTNTIDTALGEVMGLTDYADPYTLAGYVLSGDCQFAEEDSNLVKELMKAKNEIDIDTYTEMFRRADFPWKEPKSTTGESIKFPEVFSYEDQGTIYAAIPLSHAFGDYALIMYTPDTK